jgi:hypothetical protein
LVVARRQDAAGPYMLVDGHLRHAVLSDLGNSEAPCLIADDDEAFTYNKRVNRLATIQEHYMIVKAIERGVSEEKLAKALNVDIRRIKTKRTLLDGVCPEVAEMLKDKSVVNRTTRRARCAGRRFHPARRGSGSGSARFAPTPTTTQTGQPAFLRHPLPGNREGASRWTAVSFVDTALASYSGRASAATIAGISVPCSQLLG